jgi:probable rRNA maturation factor
MKESPAISAAADLDVDVVLGDGDWEGRFPEAAELCIAAARAALLHRACHGGRICILLTDDAEMRELNARFRGIDRPTNVLAFPAAETAAHGERIFLGELAIGRESVEREAAEADKPFSHHLQHLIVHGILHLLGYDHVTDADAEVMERLEVAILAAFGVDDPYRDGNGDRL